MRLASTESWVLLGALIAGTFLRCWSADLLAIEHHDEGVYASNLLFSGDAGAEFPGRAFYAPPLLPWMIEWAQIAGQLVGLGDSGGLSFLPGLVCGILLIPSAWWIARQWFSAGAGLAAAWLIALSEFHAFYSRTALTDAVVLLWMLWAVHWGWIALGDGAWRSAIIAGVLTGLAWWTKYTGWLPIAIVASGGLCHVLLTPHVQRAWAMYWRTLIGMTATAAVVWLPVLWDCQSVGGYAAVAANHRGYLQGFEFWGRNWWQQNGHLSFYTGLVSLVSTLTAFWAALIWPRPQLIPGQPEAGRCEAGLFVLLALVMAGTAFAGLPLIAWFLPELIAIALLLQRYRGSPPSQRELCAGCLVGAWTCGLMLTTPLYQPYPRLLLPLWMAGALGFAWCVHRLTDLRAIPDTYRPWFRGYAHTPVSCGLVTAGTIALCLMTTTIWEDRRSAFQSAQMIEAKVADPHESAFLVYADPALFYQLAHRNLAASPRGDVDLRPIATAGQTLLVLGSGVDRLAGFHQRWQAVEDRYHLLADIGTKPSSLVKRDGARPAEARTDEMVRVYLIQK